MVRLIIWRVGLLSCFCTTQKEVLHSLLPAHLSLPHPTALSLFLLISVSSWTDYYTVTSTPSPGFLLISVSSWTDYYTVTSTPSPGFLLISVSSWTDYYTVTSTPSPGFLFPPGQTIIPLRLLLLQDFFV